MNEYLPGSALPPHILTTPAFQALKLEGQVLGCIVWDYVVVGGYSIDDGQGLAAPIATPITSKRRLYFFGILGLALCLNGIISFLIAPTTSHAPDEGGSTMHIQRLVR